MLGKTPDPAGSGQAKIACLKNVDILVGIPSYNNARTIGHVVRAVEAGLTKYFPGRRSVLVNSDGGSSDGTTEVVREASADFDSILLDHRKGGFHKLVTPHHGIPGKGSVEKYLTFTPDAGEPAAGIAAVEEALDHLLDDRPEEAVFPLKTPLIFRDEPLEMMKKHPVENGALRMARAVDSRHIGNEVSRNGPGTGQGKNPGTTTRNGAGHAPISVENVNVR